MKMRLKHLWLAVMISTIFLQPVSINAQSLKSKELNDSLLQVLRVAKNDTAKVNLLNALAYQYRNVKADSGLYFGKLAINLAKNLQWKQGLAKAYNYTGLNYFTLSDSSNAFSNHQKALLIYQQLGDKTGEAWSQNYIGNIYFFLLSDYLKATAHYEKSFALFQQVNDKKGLATSCENLAITYESLGSYPEALQKFQQAESLDEQLHDEEALALHYGHMGIFYDDLSQFDKALEYCKRSLAIFQRSGNKTGIAHNYSSIGNIYLDYAKNEEAIKYFNKALQLNKEMNDRSAQAKTIGNMGLVYAQLMMYPEALQCQQQSFNINKALGNKSGMASSLNNIAEVYLSAPDSIMKKQGLNVETKYIKAAENLQYSIQLSKEIGEVYVQQYALQNLSIVYEKQKNYLKAYNAYKNYITIRDSILNNEKEKEITKKEIEYAYEKKATLLKAEQDKKNIIAAAEIKKQKLIKNYILISVSMVIIFFAIIIISYNRRRKTKFEKQVQEVEMKALRAQMNPHFIFNSLHSINKYIIENDKENASEYLAKFANLMRLILENSREQEVPLEKDLHALELYIQMEALRANNTFKYSIETDAELDKENILIPPMLLQPFVENAIIHGVQNNKNGLIKINVRKANEMICCVIEDNGNGKENTNQSSQFDSKTHTSLGKKIINERLNIINQLKKVKASVNIFDLKDASNKPAGMRIELLLPLELAF